MINGLCTEHIPLNEQCIRDLQTTNPHHDKSRIEATKGGLLKDAYIWILSNDEFRQWRYDRESRLLWIKGDPGKGKTMLVSGIINELICSTPDIVVVAFFFCQATDLRLSHATAVLRGLIFMLIDKRPSLIFHVRKQYDKSGKSLFEDVNAWAALAKIFTDILDDPLLQDAYLIIDALDECIAGADLLIDLITQNSSTYPHIKWVVSSRNWPDVEERLNIATQKVTLWLEVNEESVAQAVTLFIRYKVQKLKALKRYKDEVCDTVTQYLMSNAHGTFLWVALVCEELAKAKPWDTYQQLTAFPAGLSSLYERMVMRLLQEKGFQLYQRIIGALLAAYRPMTLDELPSLVDMPNTDEDGRLTTLIKDSTIELYDLDTQSFLFVLKDHTATIISIAWSEDGTRLASGSIDHTVRIWSPATGQCLLMIKEHRTSPTSLVRSPDGCQLFCRWDNNSLHIWQVSTAQCLSMLNARPFARPVWSPDGSQLALTFADDHTVGLWDPSSERASAVFGSSMHDLPSLQGHTDVVTSVRWLSDGTRLASGSRDGTIKIWDLERSISTVPSPLLYPDLVMSTGQVRSITWSWDGDRLVSGANDGTIRIWNAKNGRCLLVRESEGELGSIAWSRDNKYLASAFYYPFTESRRYSPAPQQHGHVARKIDWPNNDSRLISNMQKCRIFLWDSVTGARLSFLQGHTAPVDAIAWSLKDPKLWLASGSRDNSINVWDVATKTCLFTLEEETRRNIRSIAWSPDGNHLAS